MVAILDCFSTTERALSVTEICARSGFPKSTTHRLLAAMRDQGLLDQDRERDRYRLGLKLCELGNTAFASMDLHREARPFVDLLISLSGRAVHLAVDEGEHQPGVRCVGAPIRDASGRVFAAISVS